MSWAQTIDGRRHSVPLVAGNHFGLDGFHFGDQAQVKDRNGVAFPTYVVTKQIQRDRVRESTDRAVRVDPVLKMKDPYRRFLDQVLTERFGYPASRQESIDAAGDSRPFILEIEPWLQSIAHPRTAYWRIPAPVFRSRFLASLSVTRTAARPYRWSRDGITKCDRSTRNFVFSASVKGKWVKVMIRKAIVLKVVAIAACTTLLGGVAGATRARSKERTVEVTYSTGLSFGIQGFATACVIDPPLNSCVLVPAGLNENFASVEIVDASGLPVMATVGPHDDDPGGQPICGSTPKPVRITPGIEVEVVLNTADPAAPCPGVATTGMVKITFSKRP